MQKSPPASLAPPALWALLGYAALSVALTWPLAAGASTTLPSLGDAQLQAWVLAWDGHAMASGGAQIWDAPIFYPYPDALAFSDSLLPLALLGAPLLALSGPILAYNMLTLLSFTLSGWAVFLLARDILAGHDLPAGACGWAAAVAGAAFACCAYRMSHITQLQLLQTYWLPLALLFLRRLLGRPSSTGKMLASAALCGLLAGMQAASALYYAAFAAAALGGYTAIWALLALWRRIRHGAPLPLAQAGMALLAGAIAVASAAPFLLPYARAYAVLGIVRSPRELDGWSAPLRAYLAVPEQNRLYGWLGEAVAGPPELALFPGLLVAGLATIAAGVCLNEGWRGFSQRPGRLFWPLLAAGAFALSLGTGVRLERGGAALPIPTPYLLLWGNLPGFGALRVPARWGWLVSLALAVAAALGLARLLARLGPRWRPAAGGLALALVVAEQALRPLALPPPELLRPPPLYAWLGAPAQADIRVVLELPVARTPRGDSLQQIIGRQWFGQAHWKALPAAYSGAIPFGASDLLARAQSLPADETLSFLQLIGVDTLVVHRDEVAPAALPALLAGLSGSPRARLRAEIGASSIFSLPPDPRWAQLLAAARPGGDLYLSADERIPGLAALALARRLEAAGVRIYGQGRSRYYAPLAALPPGAVPAAALLSDAENPAGRGYRSEDLVWKDHGLALYRRAPDLLLSLGLAQPQPGRFHPTYPDQLDLDLRGQRLLVNGLPLPLPAFAGPLIAELDLARLRPGALSIDGRPVTAPAGLSTLRLPVPPAGLLRVAGDATAIVRLRLRSGALAAPALESRPGLAATASAQIVGDALELRASAAGAPSLLVDVWGAAAADDRPVHLLAGVAALPEGGSLRLRASLLTADNAGWITTREPPQDGRYIVYLKDAARPDGPGQPIMKFNLRAGRVADVEPVPLPLTVVP